MVAVSPFQSCAERPLKGILATSILMLGLLAAWQPAMAGPAPLRDAPVVWYADDMNPIPVPKDNEQPLLKSEYSATISRPIARAFNPVRWIQGGGTALVVNSLGEVPNSTFFTNRMGLRSLSVEELTTGPGADGPDLSEPWTIIGAKMGGVSMGFRIKDASGQVWLLKFDPPDHPGQSIRAGVVSNLIVNACGYHTPVDRLVIFDREHLQVGEGASIRAVRGVGGDLQLTEANLDSVLQATNSFFAGQYHALASKFLSGKPVGVVRAKGKRKDDPNDTVPHEMRRDWRGLRIICSWINHIDMKDANSLAMYIGEPGEGYVKRYLIDFASTLGTSGAESFAKFGFEHGLDFQATTRRIFTFGLSHDDWQEIAWPEHLSEVGFWSSERFDPTKWRSISPQSSFANCDDHDAYWATKIISSFTDEDLRILVEQGHYQDERSVDWITTHLTARRDIIARTWFDRLAPLDFFVHGEDALTGHDLGAERGVYPDTTPQYRWRVRPVDAERSGDDWSAWTDASTLAMDPTSGLAACSDDQPFLAISWQVNRGDQWQGPVTVYLASRSGRIVAVDR